MTELERLEKEVQDLRCLVVEGNGKPSHKQQLAVLEQRLNAMEPKVILLEQHPQTCPTAARFTKLESKVDNLATAFSNANTRKNAMWDALSPALLIVLATVVIAWFQWRQGKEREQQLSRLLNIVEMQMHERVP